jgi:hypothetical protein
MSPPRSPRFREVATPPTLTFGRRNRSRLASAVICAVALVASTSCLRKLAELEHQRHQQADRSSGVANGTAAPAPPGDVRPVDLPMNRGPVRSRIRSEGSRRYLEVDGEPFLILAVQADAWAVASATEGAARQFRYAREVGANTIEIPIPWIHVEPTADHYSSDYVRWVIEQARANDLKLVLLWFGSNVVGKTGSPTELKIVPDYVVSNPSAYPRVSGPLARAENPLEPSHPATLDRERRAFTRALEMVTAEDREGRVIAWQILNEVGVLPETRVPYPESVLTDKLISHVRALAQVQKRIHPVPSFMNFWEGLQGAKPFEFLSRIPEIDFVGPDLYGKPSLGFHIANRDYVAFRDNYLKQLDRYHQGRNLSFIPETNNDAYFKPYLLIFPLLGKVPGIGMDVWAITTGSMKGYEPLANAKTGQITESGALLREVYRAIGGAMSPIVSAQGSDRMAWFVSEGPARGRRLTVAGTELALDTEGDGGLLAVRQSDGSLVLVGRNVGVTMPRAAGRNAERGRFEASRWRAAGPAKVSATGGDALRVELGTADVVRVGPDR